MPVVCRLILLSLFVSLAAVPSFAQAPQPIVLLPPGEGNPRNSEGDFVELADGRVLLVYTHFFGGAGDHAKAHLASRISSDGGKTWSEEEQVVVPNEGGLNVMSVSLLRLEDGRIALFYLRKNSHTDCRPMLRTSDDEGKTWSEATPVIGEDDENLGYYVLNNDRVVQLKSGRLLAPVAQHVGPGMPTRNNAALMICYYSDDRGETWQRGQAAPRPPKIGGNDVITQEPSVVELTDGRVLMFCRTNAGSQYVCHSEDKGETWSQLAPSDIKSPLSPATMERIPSTGDLLLLWNDHSDIPENLRGKRTPLRAAISQDDGQTWIHVKTLEDNPHGWYCYTALDFVGGHALLAYCSGDRRENNGLAQTSVLRVPVEWFYE